MVHSFLSAKLRKMRTARVLATCMFAVLLFCSVSAFAESEQDSPRFTVTGMARYTGEADFSDNDASFSRATQRISAEYSIFTVSFENAAYWWTDTHKLGFGTDKSEAPWKNLYSINASAMDTIMLNKQWFTTLAAQVSSNFEKAPEADSLTVSGLGMIGFGFSRDFSISAGLGISRTPVDFRILPAASLQYTKDAWMIELGIPRTSVKYTVSDTLAVHADLGMLDAVYALDNDGPVTENGYTSIHETSAGLYADWSPVEDLTITAGPEYRFGRSIQIYDSAEEKIWDKQDVEDAFGATLRVKYAF